MGFLQSPLFKNIQQGELPTVNTNVEVDVPKPVLLNIGIMVVSVAAVITLLVIVTRVTTK